MTEDENVMEMPLVLPRVFYMVLLAFGIGFYIIWSAMFGAWTDLAVYTISVICIGLGFTGVLLYTLREREGPTD